MSQPTLRCPECGQAVNLPAESCPCGYDFRVGRKPAPEKAEEPGGAFGKIHLVLGGAAILVLLILMAIFFLARSKTPPPQAQAPPIPVASESPLLNPQKPIGQAKDAATLANEKVQALKDTQAEIDSERAQ
jgi:hypothetical protein